MQTINRRVEDYLIDSTAWRNAVVYSSKLEQKAKPRPIYAADRETREVLRVFAAAATDLAREIKLLTRSQLFQLR